MINEVAEVDWSNVCNSVDVNEACGLFSLCAVLISLVNLFIYL